MNLKIKISSKLVLLFLFVGYILLVGLINPRAFFSVSTLSDMLRGASVYGILALGFLPIIIAGGIDMSFTAVSAFSTYVTVVTLAKTGNSEAPLLIYYGLAIVVGSLLGLANGFLVATLKVPTIVVTLGTSAMISGFMLFKFGSTIIFTLPPALAEFSRSGLTFGSADTVGGVFHPAILIWLVLSIFMWGFLKYTLLGRNIYALGGNPLVFERSGASRFRLELLIFSLSGAFSAIAGITFACLYRIVNPAMFSGQELDVIAMVVLGGAAITGGKGTIMGTIIGILFINLLKNSLILINVPSAWQVLVIGIVLFLGVFLPILYDKSVKGGK
ncbi:MAG: ABC transporter permease [Brevinema sp.]